jgi:hypothetical protein
LEAAKEDLMKKIGMLSFSLILVMGLLGVGYAAWNQTLNVQGVVATAYFEVNMTNGAPTKPANAPNTVIAVSPNIANKSANNADGNAGLLISMTNAVPGVYTIPNVVIHNGSSIPLHITVTAAAGDGLNGHLDGSSWISVPVSSALSPGTYILASGASTTGATVTITIPDTVTQTSTYGFIISVTAAQ